VNSGIKNVIFAVSDPNPQASGGAEFLRSQGITVISGECEREAAWSNRAWLTKIKLNRPRFVWKIAATLDAKVNAIDGSSQWITGVEARAKVSHMRNKSDAVLAGTGTVLADNPSFNVRRELVGENFDIRNPERIVVGEREIPSEFAIHDKSAVTTFIENHDLSELIRVVNQKGFNEVLVESGSLLGTSLMEAGIVDELHIFIAPKILGNGANFLGDLGITNINQAKNLQFIGVEMVRNDIEVIAVINDNEKVGI
jgi:diaminohydroxyphosphoribosylaminopyrimidine deaminase/5-amino-6-(5-phosphoribosylamino)uracil reductase